MLKQLGALKGTKIFPMHKYLDAEKYIQIYRPSWWPHGADSGETGEIFLGVLRPATYRIFLKKFITPPNNIPWIPNIPYVSWNRFASTGPQPFPNDAISGWIQVTPPSLVVRPIRQQAIENSCRGGPEWESDPGKLRFLNPKSWRISYWKLDNFEIPY